MSLIVSLLLPRLDAPSQYFETEFSQKGPCISFPTRPRYAARSVPPKYSFQAKTWHRERPAYGPRPPPSSFATAGPLRAAAPRARAKSTAVQHTRTWASARSRADRPVTSWHHEPAYTAGEFCPVARERKHAPRTKSSHLRFCTHLSFCGAAFMPYRQSRNLPAKGL